MNELSYRADGNAEDLEFDWSVYGLESNADPVEYRDPDYCDCGHFHTSPVECPDESPCGDYRCCH